MHDQIILSPAFPFWAQLQLHFNLTSSFLFFSSSHLFFSRWADALTMRYILWLFFSSLSFANFIPPNQRCVTAVFTAYNYLTFDPSASIWDSRCRNHLEVTSIYAASDIYCNPDQQTAGLAQLNALCRRFAHADLLARDQLADNLTDDAIRRMKVVDYGEIPRREALNESVLVSHGYFTRTFRTIDDWQFVNGKHNLYGYVCYIFWAGILLFGILNRLFHHVWKNRRVTGQPWKSCQALSRLFQTHLVVPAPRQFLGLTLPTRIDAVILGLFWLLNTVLSCVSYPTFEGNL